MPCLPSSEQPLSRLARSHLIPPVWRLLTTGQEVLLCFLNAPSFSAVIDFTMPLLPLPGSTGQGSGVLAVSRGGGQIPPEVRSCKRGNRPQACPHRLCHSLTPGRPILAQSHTAVAVSASPVARNHSSASFSFRADSSTSRQWGGRSLGETVREAALARGSHWLRWTWAFTPTGVSTGTDGRSAASCILALRKGP